METVGNQVCYNSPPHKQRKCKKCHICVKCAPSHTCKTPEKHTIPEKRRRIGRPPGHTTPEVPNMTTMETRDPSKGQNEIYNDFIMNEELHNTQIFLKYFLKLMSIEKPLS